MNKFRSIRNGVLFSSIALTFTACVHDDDYSIPPVVCNQQWEANTNISEIKALNNTNTPFQITDEKVVEGYVVSSDETGNIYGSIIIQDSPINPTIGISVELSEANTYTKYPVGSKILINTKDLYVGKDRGTYKIGSTYEKDGVIKLGRMSELQALKKLERACGDLVEVVPTTYSSISQAKKEENISTLVKLENVHFLGAEKNITYYDKDDKNTFGGATNRTLVDADGNKITVRTSKYAKFKDEIIPKGSGTVIGILSAYASNNNVTSSSYQLTLRNTEDVQLNNPIVNIIGSEEMIGGAQAAYTSCLTLDFEKYGDKQFNFPKYPGLAAQGEKYWSVKDFKNNKYLQMSAYKTGETNEAYFVIPVDFDKADTFSFQTQDRVNKGDVLSVLYSPDYKIGEGLNLTNLVDITSEFKIASGTTTAQTKDFVNSGEYSLANLSGKGALVFKYLGSDGGVSTTMHIDNIKVVDNDNCQGNSDDDDSSGSNDNEYPNAILAESFTNGIPDTWANVSEKGDRKWLGKSFKNFFFAQNSAFKKDGSLDMVSWLITPQINFDEKENEKLILKIADAYNNGMPLKVMYSTDFDGSSPTSANWTEIGKNEIAALASNTGQYDNMFEQTQPIDLSNISGKAYIAFVYDSKGGTITTTIQLDQVIVD